MPHFQQSLGQQLQQLCSTAKIVPSMAMDRSREGQILPWRRLAASTRTLLLSQR